MMLTKIASEVSMLDQALAAAGDPTRRAIIQRLAHGSATVGQLAALFPISRPAVSQHLRVLKEAGFVRQVDASRTSAYELNPAPLLEIEDWARTLASVWERAPLIIPPSSPLSRKAAP